jgi:hypothetical protein
MELVTSPQSGNCVLNDLSFNNAMSLVVLGHVPLFSFIRKITNIESSDAAMFTDKSEQAHNIEGISEECTLIQIKQVHRL